MTDARKNAIKELLFLVALATMLGVLFTRVIYPLLGISGNAPVPVRSLLLLAAATYFLHRNGERWVEFGLRRFSPWWKLLAATLALLTCKLLLFQPFADFLADLSGAGRSDHSCFAHLYKNTGAFVLWLAIAWVAGAFAEEMVVRGYLLGRLTSLLGPSRLASVLAVLSQAVLFGLGHGYLGPRGMISSGVTALGFGLFVLACRGNLWPVILAHGLWDTLGLTLLYSRGEASL